MLAPEDFTVNHKTQFMPDTPVIKQTADGTLYTWSLNNEPAIEYEYYMPGLEDIGKMLHVSSIENWGFLVDWYSDLARTKTRHSFEIKEAVTSLFSEHKTYSDQQKIKKIYDFITENIRYSYIPFRQSALVPQRARNVLVNRIGDCKDKAALCISMLREVGLEGDFVLLNTRNYGRNEHVLASIAFDHVIVAVETEQGRLYIDPGVQPSIRLLT